MSIQEARKALKENPARAHRDVVRLVSKIIIPENVPASKALATVEKPREAEVIQPYKRGSYVAPPVPSSSGGPEPDKGPSGAGSGARAARTATATRGRDRSRSQNQVRKLSKKQRQIAY